MATGIFLGGSGLALMAILVSVDGGYLSVLPGYLVMGLGMGLSMTPLHRGHHLIAAARTTRCGRRPQRYRPGSLEAPSGLLCWELSWLPDTATRSARVWKTCRSEPLKPLARGLAGALSLVRGAEPYAASLLRSAREAFVSGWRQAMGAGVIVMAAVLVYVLVRGPKRNN